MRAFVLKSSFVMLMMLISLNVMAATEVTSQETQITAPAAAPAPEQTGTSAANGSASEGTKGKIIKASAVTLPVQVVMVRGDHQKFQALNWQSRGYSGGVKDFSLQYDAGDDVLVDLGGRAIMGNNDYKGLASITKKDFGYLKFDFKQFRKYYDSHGGVYYPFVSEGTASPSPELSRDLHLDIGHFGIEAGMTRPDLPTLSIYYEHDYKDGAKSMLDWGAVTEGPTDIKKLISPSWKEIDETTDTFGIKGEHTLKGYHFTGDQRWEIVRTKTRQYRPLLSDDGNPDDSVEVRQKRELKTDMMMTTMTADKWYLNEKIFASSAYRFEHLKNQENQDLMTFNSDGTTYFNDLFWTPTKPNAVAHNEMNLNSWVLNLMASPKPWLTGNARFKADVLEQDSIFFSAQDIMKDDNDNPLINYTNKGLTNSNTYRFGESFGVRFKAIPRTAIYSDLDFQQSTNRLIQDQASLDPSTDIAIAHFPETMFRNAVVSQPSTTWTLGGNFLPWRFLNFTSQFRYRDAQTKFTNESAYPEPLTTTTGLVELDKYHIWNVGFNQRVTLYLTGWAQTSFRYMFNDTKYKVFAVEDPVSTKAKVLSNTYVYDFTVFPLPELSMTGSFTRLLSTTRTMGESGFPTYFPAFTSNSDTWMFSTNYQVHKKVNLESSLFYTLADNFNDFSGDTMTTETGLPYGASFNQIGLTVGCKWDIRKDLAIRPRYAFFNYAPDKNVDAGGYSANALSVEFISTWG